MNKNSNTIFSKRYGYGNYVSVCLALTVCVSALQGQNSSYNGNAIPIIASGVQNAGFGIGVFASLTAGNNIVLLGTIARLLCSMGATIRLWGTTLSSFVVGPVKMWR